DGAAIEDDVRPVRARGRRMDRARCELLAGTALALDEHGDVGRSHALEHPEDLAHRDGFSDELAEMPRGRGSYLALVPAGMDGDRRLAHAKHGAEWNLRLGELRAAEEGAIVAAEILHDDASCDAAYRYMST